MEKMSDWQLHIPDDDNRIVRYKSGLIAGQMVRLRRDIIVKDSEGKPTGEVYKEGEVWLVLPGITSDPVLWFKMQNGERCTWDDDINEINKWFQILEE